MARIAGVLLVMAVVAGCTADVGTTTTSLDTPTTTTSSLPVSTSTTTRAVPPTSSTSTTTSTTVVGPPVITLSGGDVAYTIDGDLLVEGWVDRLADVTIGGAPATTYDDPRGRTSFVADLSELDTGTLEFPVEARTADGSTSSLMLTVVHDPTLGREFAYLVEVDADGGTLVADYAQWFAGEAAEEAAAEDGAANEDGSVDGGFYIRNVNDRLRTLEVDPDVRVTLQACWPGDSGPCVTREPVDWGAFAEAFADPESVVDDHGWFWYGYALLPYWLLIDDGTVVAIEEHYLP